MVFIKSCSIDCVALIPHQRSFFFFLITDKDHYGKLQSKEHKYPYNAQPQLIHLQYNPTYKTLKQSQQNGQEESKSEESLISSMRECLLGKKSSQGGCRERLSSGRSINKLCYIKLKKINKIFYTLSGGDKIQKFWIQYI